jgi:hypothetical protein
MPTYLIHVKKGFFWLAADNIYCTWVRTFRGAAVKLGIHIPTWYTPSTSANTVWEERGE